MEEKIALRKNTETILQIENIRFGHLNEDVYRETENRQNESTDGKYDTGAIMHTHAYVEIFGCPCGSFCIQTEKGICTLFKGDIVIVPVGVRHTLMAGTERAFWCAERFQFTKVSRRNSRDLFSSLERLCECDGLKLFRHENAAAELLHTVHRKLPEDNFYIKAMQLLQLLLQLAETDACKTEEAPLLKADSNMERIEQLDYIIYHCYMKSMTQKEIAERLFISESQLNRICRRRYNASLHSVLLERRLQAAKQLLLKTDMNIEEIAGEIGFRSPAILYQEFRRKYGMTPRQFRKSAQ